MKTQEALIESTVLNLIEDKSMIMVAEESLEELRYSLDTRLSEHFTLGEFVRSKTAIDKNIDNMPGEEEVERLRQLCIYILEPLRRKFGVIRITSGYRCFRLNDLVGGSRTSQHMYGEAADIYVGSTEVGRKMYDFIFKKLTFDQMLLEVKRDNQGREIIHCLHISYKSDRGVNRKICKMHYPVKK